MEALATGRGGTLDETGRIALAPLGLNALHGLSFNPSASQLLLLDAAGRQIVNLTMTSEQDLEGPASSGADQLERTNLAVLNNGQGSIAYDEQSGDTLILDGGSDLLYRIGASGQPLVTYDLSELNLVQPAGMVVAPSGDNTDDPAVTSLYIADAGSLESDGRIVELSFEQPQVADALYAAWTATVVSHWPTDNWLSPSSDPAGIIYLPENGGELLISDSEINDFARGADEIDLVNSGLEETMTKAYHEIREIKQRHEGIDLRTASMVSAIDKIASVYKHRGLFP